MNISVIIPVYNRAELLNRAIDSVLAQTYPCKEIIIVDDGSTDELTGSHFLEKVATFMNCEVSTTSDNGLRCSLSRESGYLDLKVLRQENKGVSSARNLGINHAIGEWIAFLDSDDYWLPSKLEAQVKFHKENPEILISQTDEVWIRNSVRINPNKRNVKVGGDIYEASLARCMISPSAVLLHKSLLDLVGTFDETLPACEDYDLWLRVTCKHKVGLIGEKLVIKTGGHSDQLSKKYEAMDRFRVRALEKIIKNGYLSHGQKEQAKIILDKKMNILLNGATKRNKNYSLPTPDSRLLTEHQPNERPQS